MNWKVMRLELASNEEFPRGSAGRTYLLRVPLTDEGEIDADVLDDEPDRAIVRRYWANEADKVGYLVRTPSGLVIRYETNQDIALGHSRKIGSHVEAPRLGHRPGKVIPKMLQIIPPALEGIDLRLIDVKPDHAMPRKAKRPQQRQPYVSEPNDANDG